MSPQDSPPRLLVCCLMEGSSGEWGAGNASADVDRDVNATGSVRLAMPSTTAAVAPHDASATAAATATPTAIREWVFPGTTTQLEGGLLGAGTSTAVGESGAPQGGARTKFCVVLPDPGHARPTRRGGRGRRRGDANRPAPTLTGSKRARDASNMQIDTDEDGSGAQDERRGGGSGGGRSTGGSGRGTRLHLMAFLAHARRRHTCSGKWKGLPLWR